MFLERLNIYIYVCQGYLSQTLFLLFFSFLFLFFNWYDSYVLPSLTFSRIHLSDYNGEEYIYILFRKNVLERVINIY